MPASATYEYDPNGNRSLRVDARGWPTTDFYDALDRETSRRFRNNTRVTHTYGIVGDMLTQRDVTGVTSYIYNQVRRPTQVVFPTGQRFTLVYDPVYQGDSIVGMHHQLHIFKCFPTAPGPGTQRCDFR